MKITTVPFDLGEVVATPGVEQSIPEAEQFDALDRHARCDWGLVSDADWQTNDRAVLHGERILSAYQSGATRFWIITEATREHTIILLPEEY